jgi:hypothetical protein
MGTDLRSVSPELCISLASALAAVFASGAVGAALSASRRGGIDVVLGILLDIRRRNLLFSRVSEQI